MSRLSLPPGDVHEANPEAGVRGGPAEQFCTYSQSDLTSGGEDTGNNRLDGGYGAFINTCWRGGNDFAGGGEDGFTPVKLTSNGNSLLKVRYHLVIGFAASWSFRLETRAFTGGEFIHALIHSLVYSFTPPSELLY